MRRPVVAAIPLLAVALLLSACCGPLLSRTGRTGEPAVEIIEPSPYPTYTPYPTCEPTSAGSIELSPSAGLKGSEDQVAFLEDLADALEGEGWAIVDVTEDYITVENPESELKTVLLYGYESPLLSRIIIQVIFMGQGADNNLSYTALEDYNRVNDSYNVGKVSADEDGDLWFETVYTFADTLDPAALSEYLNWLDDTLFLMVDELGDYTS